jgi:rod shape-determining protein MreC
MRRPLRLASSARGLTKRQRISATVLAIVALAFLLLDLGGGGLRSAHSGMRGVLGSLYRGTDAVLGPARRFVEGVPSAGSNEATIQSLRKQNRDLQARLDQLEADRRTAAELDRLRLSVAQTGDTLLPAQVIALGPGSGFDWTVTIDAGSGSGVRAGQTVTDGVGLVGRVLHADANTAVVLLAADPGSGVGVRDVRTGEVGVARGHGTAGYTFTPLSPDAVVKVGDRLETGPLSSSSFVPGVAVGMVSSVRTSADGTVTATVRPSVSPTSLALVGVILGGGDHGTVRAALRPASGQSGALMPATQTARTTTSTTKTTTKTATTTNTKTATTSTGGR